VTEVKHNHHYGHVHSERCAVCGKSMPEAIDEARDRLAQRELIERQTARRLEREAQRAAVEATK
jgi:ribosomal protein S26